jgi:hypothetical protein
MVPRNHLKFWPIAQLPQNLRSAVLIRVIRGQLLELPRRRNRGISWLFLSFSGFDKANDGLKLLYLRASFDTSLPQKQASTARRGHEEVCVCVCVCVSTQPE